MMKLAAVIGCLLVVIFGLKLLKGIFKIALILVCTCILIKVFGIL